ncbi:MAG: hypothetical protein U0169_14725 [Polyangiaceae bacterium]
MNVVPRALERFAPVLVALAGVLSCSSDPVRSAQREEAGPELPNIPQGEYHRAGQQCTACHNSDGSAPDFSIAGTVFYGPKKRQGVKGVVVTMRDSAGKFEKTTNCVGNFFVRREEWNPKFPVAVSLSFQDGENVQGIAMQSAIFREGSCAYCHKKPNATFRSVGHVALTLNEEAEAAYEPPSGCPAPTVAAVGGSGEAVTSSDGEGGTGGAGGK